MRFRSKELRGIRSDYIDPGKSGLEANQDIYSTLVANLHAAEGTRMSLGENYKTKLATLKQLLRESDNKTLLADSSSPDEKELDVKGLKRDIHQLLKATDHEFGNDWFSSTVENFSKKLEKVRELGRYLRNIAKFLLPA